jgi:hypothetical protein
MASPHSHSPALTAALTRQNRVHPGRRMCSVGKKPRITPPRSPPICAALFAPMKNPKMSAMMAQRMKRLRSSRALGPKRWK